MCKIIKSICLALVCLLILSSCNQTMVNIPISTANALEITATQTITPLILISTPLVLLSKTLTATPVSVNGVLARQYLKVLSETIGARLSGSSKEMQAARYIQTEFEKMGYETQVQHFSFTSEENDEDLSSSNIIIVKKGFSSREIIIGAHYDSVDNVPGADDNASGVAVMLEVAKKIYDLETPFTIRFIAFGGEENDLNGSRYYVSQMTKDEIKNTVDMINLDGLIAGDLTYVYGDTGSSNSLRDWVLKTARDASYKLEGKTAKDLDYSDGTPCDCADYGPFQKAGIPFAFFEAANWNLGDQDGWIQVSVKFGEQGVIRHTSYDNTQYLDKTFPGRIDDHLKLYVTLLYDALTQFKLAN